MIYRSPIRIATLAAMIAWQPTVHAAESNSSLLIGLSQYSLRELFASGELDPLDYPAFAKREFGITQIDVWEGGLPADKLNDPSYLMTLRRRAEEIDSEIFLLMSGVVDASASSEEERKARAAEHFPAIDRAATLGCQYLRLFLKAPSEDRFVAIGSCVEVLRVLSDHSRERGVTIVIEPGASAWSSQGDFLADVMVALHHSHCRLMPDFGKLRGDVYTGTRVMMPHAAVISAKTHEFNDRGQQIDFDYGRLMKIILDSGFSGVLAIEWEGKGLTPAQGVTASKQLIERCLSK